MTWRKATAVAIAFVSFVPMLGLVAAVRFLDIAHPDVWGLSAAFVTFGLVGAVIVARVPGNRLGWVFAAVGVILPLGALQDLGRPLLEAGTPPDVVVLGQIAANISWTAGLVLILVFTPSWFPDGRPLSRRWGWFNILAGTALASATAMALLAPQIDVLWDRTSDSWLTLPNPIGVGWIPDFEKSLPATAVAIAVLSAAVAALASLVIRYRRSGAVPMLQIRWLMTSFSILIPVVVLTQTVNVERSPVMGLLFDIGFSLAILAVPVSAGVAITKYRLYDLGRLVSRTVTYAAVAGALAAVFAVGAVWLPQQLPTANNNLMIAASTLAVAAFFDPLRSRVRRLVDRRFNRLPYDADLVVGRLSTDIRDEVDPASIVHALLGAAVSSLHPSRAGVWTRTGP